MVCKDCRIKLLSIPQRISKRGETSLKFKETFIDIITARRTLFLDVSTGLRPT